jgi:hypothetical protein
VPAQAPVGADTQRAFEAAKASLRAGRTADAERAFRDLSARHPELGGAHANLGLILRNAGKHDESVAAMEKAVKASPSQAVFHNQLGLSLRHAGKFAKAREAYEAALALDPGYADAHLNLGVLLDLYLAEPALALVHYERYLALVPGGDAGVGKWVADLKTRKTASVAQPMRRTRRRCHDDEATDSHRAGGSVAAGICAGPCRHRPHADPGQSRVTKSTLHRAVEKALARRSGRTTIGKCARRGSRTRRPGRVSPPGELPRTGRGEGSPGWQATLNSIRKRHHARDPVPAALAGTPIEGEAP